VLYNKWRPQTFGDVVGQEPTVRTLQNSLASGQVAHAYIFAGPRGSGKTSLARILAKALNCLQGVQPEPCGKCDACTDIVEGRFLDLVELDAASNRGIEDIRDLRERVNFAPVNGRYKFYLIDEVHQLTPEASNALLKTLEEPPDHAVFVLATTEIHRVLPTILSRCQRFDFRRIPVRSLVGRLQEIAEAEKVSAETEALNTRARRAGGSARDAGSLFHPPIIYAEDGVSATAVREMLGLAHTAVVAEFVDTLARRDTTEGLRVLSQAADQGLDMRQFARETIRYLRGTLLHKSGMEAAELLEMSEEEAALMDGLAGRISLAEIVQAIRLFSEAEQALRLGVFPQLPVELALVEFCAKDESPSASPAPMPASRQTAPTSPPQAAPQSAPPASATAAGTPPADATNTADATETSSDPSAAATKTTELPPSATAAAEAADTPLAEIQQRWDAVVDSFRRPNVHLRGVLRDCTPIAVQDRVLTLEFAHAWHRDQVRQSDNLILVEKAIAQTIGRHFSVECTLAQRDSSASAYEKDPAHDPVVRKAQQLFPGTTTYENADEDSSSSAQ
ncbi:MAG: DNA polymerase III subunit gamma/tau, partial [Chloroflexi bacterium]|nr:DNA polymerase III subunit gamma/tau [Chloroflexota bacterium]